MGVPDVMNVSVPWLFIHIDVLSMRNKARDAKYAHRVPNRTRPPITTSMIQRQALPHKYQSVSLNPNFYTAFPSAISPPTLRLQLRPR